MQQLPQSGAHTPVQQEQGSASSSQQLTPDQQLWMQVRSQADQLAGMQGFMQQLAAQQQAAQQQQPQQQQQQLRATIPSSVKLPSPPAFAGDTRDSLQVWLFQVEDFFHLARLTDDDIRIRTAGALLRDKAAIWYRAVRSGELPEELSVRTWAEFVQGLHDNFRPMNAVKLARDRLATLTMSGSVREYISDFRNIVLDIPRMAEDEKMDRFTRGLKPSLRREVDLKEPEKLEDAIRIAERLDASGREAGKGSYGTRFSDADDTPAPQSGGPRPMDMNAINREQKFKPLTAEDRAELMAEGRCFYCREEGHTIKECPKRPKGGKD
jgi:hypothetical protein